MRSGRDAPRIVAAERDDVAAELRRTGTACGTRADSRRAAACSGRCSISALSIAVQLGIEMLDTRHEIRAGETRGVQQRVDVEIVGAVPAQVRAGELALRMREI